MRLCPLVFCAAAACAGGGDLCHTDKECKGARICDAQLGSCVDPVSALADLRPADEQDQGDMRGSFDPADLREAPDLRWPSDLPDVPMLTGLPACGAASITAEFLYERTVKSNCNAYGCHPTINSATTLRGAWVGQPAMGTKTMRIVERSDIHHSYVLYKLMGQHAAPPINGAGDRMPKGSPALSDADLCNFINWVASGGN